MGKQNNPYGSNLNNASEYLEARDEGGTTLPPTIESLKGLVGIWGFRTIRQSLELEVSYWLRVTIDRMYRIGR